MRIKIIVFTALLLALQVQNIQAKDKNDTHSFKITGNTKTSTPTGVKTVEYDPESADHLFISNYNLEGKINSRTQFLFKGKKFSLSDDLVSYINNMEMVPDGTTIYYKGDLIEKSLIYQQGKLVQEDSFYPDGQKKSSVPGAEELNGDYKLWHPNGQLSFSGTYRNNQKDGNFELFDESGTLIKKAIYMDGKLIAGDPVVQNIIYSSPDVPATFAQGGEAFNEYLTKKASETEAIKLANPDKTFNLKITFDQYGKPTNVESLSRMTQPEGEFINKIFAGCPNFVPAKIENIPVQSIQKMTLTCTNGIIKLTPEEKIYTNVDCMPEFPGGTVALRQFIATSVRYPIQAMKENIQGKVFVSFVVDRDGSITQIKIVRGAHPLLDAEAVRVVTAMPKYSPGILNGKAVKVAYTIPINFINHGVINRSPF